MMARYWQTEAAKLFLYSTPPFDRIPGLHILYLITHFDKKVATIRFDWSQVR
jgi:hypothetical protein